MKPKPRPSFTWAYMEQAVAEAGERMAGLKRCGTCGAWKGRGEFHRDRCKFDGLCWTCKKCNCRKDAARRDGHKKQFPALIRPARKWCSRCGLVKDLTEFVIGRAQPSGVQGYCKTCQVGYNKARDDELRQTVIPPSHKVCFKCKADKPSSEFYRCVGQLSGLHSCCKPCAREYNRGYYARRAKPKPGA